jgi:enoyl-CoA hydratase
MKDALLALSHMAFACLQYSTAPDGAATILFNRPEKLNALNRQTVKELDEAITLASEDPAVRGLLLTGAGEKAFVAGADINELAASTPVEAARFAAFGQKIFRRLETMGKPSVAAINGFALGGGLELAMCCTVRVAAETAKLGQPEVKLGIIPGYGGTQRLPRLIGHGRALEMLLTGDPVAAADAWRMGLVNHVVPGGELLDFSRALLAKMTAQAPRALELTLRAADIGAEANLDEALEMEAACFGLAASTEDCKEGVRAFLEKRKANFTGR